MRLLGDVVYFAAAVLVVVGLSWMFLAWMFTSNGAAL